MTTDNNVIAEDIIFAGRYRLNRRLGRGSFGEVWHATDMCTAVDVAIKIYIHLDDEGIKEFCSEFSNVHDLNHTNLLRPDYFDVDGSRPYLVMTYCPASSADLVGSCTPEALRRFIADVAAGLSYLHAAGIVHRDIKPDNVLCTTNGSFVITDFGLSRNMRATLRRNSRSVVSEQVSGSISYMSPELFKASPAYGPESDIWALGASAIEIATGELPFIGQGGVMQLHGAEMPVLPDNIPATVREVINRCLDADPANRPTAAEVVKMIETPDNKPDKPDENDKTKTKSKNNKKIGRQTVKDDNVVINANDGKRKHKGILIAVAVIIVAAVIASVMLTTTSKPAEPPVEVTEAVEPTDPGKEYLAQNGKRFEVTTTASGLQYEIHVNGKGPRPLPGSNVKVDYVGSFTDGTVFDKGENVVFPLDAVIPGFSEGLQLMPVGSKWTLYIPAELAYGAAGVPGSIEPNSTLIFFVSLKNVE